MVHSPPLGIRAVAHSGPAKMSPPPAAINTPGSGPFNGSVVNPDTGRPVIPGEEQVRRADFRKVKLAETVWPESDGPRRLLQSSLAGRQGPDRTGQRIGHVGFSV